VLDQNKKYIIKLPGPKTLYMKLTVPWLEYCGKSIGLKNKKSACNHDILHQQHLFSVLSPKLGGHGNMTESCLMAHLKEDRCI